MMSHDLPQTPMPSAPRGIRISSLYGKLVLIPIALLLAAMVTAGFLLTYQYSQARASTAQQLMATTQALALAVDRQIGQERILLRALAASQVLHNGNYSDFDAVARASLGDGNWWVVLLDPTGQELINTRYPPGTSLPRVTILPKGVTWTTLEPGLRISSLFFGGSERIPLIILARDVMQDDGTKLDLSIAAPIDVFAKILEQQHLPAGWISGIMDMNLTVLARAPAVLSYIGRSGSEKLRNLLKQSDSGSFETQTFEGEKTFATYRRLPEYGWTVAVAVPMTQVLTTARRSVVLGSLFGTLFLGIGIVLAVRMVGQIAAPIEGLALATRNWAKGDNAHIPKSGIREIDELGSAFAETTSVIRKQNEDLHQLNTMLETRIAERTRELQEANEHLFHAQKLEAIGQLTGGIAHDFNNLLMVVRGNLDLLSRHVSEASLKQYVDHAREGCARAAKLTSQLLAFSRKQRLQLEVFDVNACVGRVSEILKGTLGGTIRIETHRDAEAPYVLADTSQLELMLLNLAINARDAMPDGGTLTISTSNISIKAASMRVEQPQPGNYVLIALSDTGTGMTENILSRAFDPFFTTKPVGQGSGLGLSQVLGIAKQLGGGVEIESQPDKGTTVRIYLPHSA